MSGADSFAPSMRGWHAPGEAIPRDGTLRRHVLDMGVLPRGGAMLDARIPLLFNAELTISCARPTRDDDAFLSNSDADEIAIVIHGAGRLEGSFGSMAFHAADLLWIPRGLPIGWRPESDDVLVMILELRSRVGRAEEQVGRALPLASRVVRPVEAARTHDAESEQLLVIKRRDRFFERASKLSSVDPTRTDAVPIVWMLESPMRAVEPDPSVACLLAPSGCRHAGNAHTSFDRDEVAVPVSASPDDEASSRLTFVPVGVAHDDANPRNAPAVRPSTLVVSAYAPLALTPNAIAIEVREEGSIVDQ